MPATESISGRCIHISIFVRICKGIRPRHLSNPALSTHPCFVVNDAPACRVVNLSQELLCRDRIPALDERDWEGFDLSINHRPYLQAPADLP